jgi:hypothetical protein
VFIVRLSTPIDLFRRALAGAMAALVLALALATASPAAHDLLHQPDRPRTDDHCAVMLFASGVSMPLGCVHVAAPTVAWQPFVRVCAPEVFISAPRYLRLPSQGPPELG